MKKIMMVMTVLFTCVFTQAQPPQPTQANGNKNDRVEALRIAFISQQLNLSPQEAQNFWPVYNQYRGDLETLRKNFKHSPEAPLTAEQQIDLEQKRLDLKKKYKNQFEGALGKEKINQLYNLENQFHQKLKELKEQRQQMRGNQQGPPPRPQGGGRQGGRF